MSPCNLPFHRLWRTFYLAECEDVMREKAVQCEEKVVSSDEEIYREFESIENYANNTASVVRIVAPKG